MQRRIYSFCIGLCFLMISTLFLPTATVLALTPTISRTPTSTAIPGADFFGTPLSGNAPLVVQFTHTSVSVLSSCTWNFGDGTSQSYTLSNATNCPTTSHTYTTDGAYTVSLSVMKVTGATNSMTKTGYIRVGASFITPTVTPTIGCGSVIVVTSTATPVATNTPNPATSTTTPSCRPIYVTATVTPTVTATPTGGVGYRTIAGTVTDATTGAPIAGATVVCSHFSYFPSVPSCNSTTTTAANGGYSFGNFFIRDTDSITVNVQAAGYTSQSTTKGGMSLNNSAINFALVAGPTMTPPTGYLKVQMVAAGTDNTQQSTYNFKVMNTSASSVSNISARIYFTTDGSNAASSYVLEKYYDQSGVATVSGPTLLSGTTYYFTVSYGTASLAAGSSWTYNTSMHLSSWDSTFNSTNDFWHGTGILPTAYTDWSTIPAYITGSLAWGSQPGGITPTFTPSKTPTLFPDGIDLTVVSATFVGSTPACANAPKDNVVVKNAGILAAGSFVVSFGSQTQTVSGLAAGQSVTLSFNAIGQGTATADSTNVIAESNETNNTLTVSLPIPTQAYTCTPLPGTPATPTITPTFTLTPTNTVIIPDPTPISAPDLWIQSVVTSPIGWTGGCTTNQTMGVRVTIINNGQFTLPAGPFVVDVNGSQQTVSGLAANATITLWFQQTGSMVVTVDATNLVSELNENNNSVSYVSITATPPTICTLTPSLTPIITITPSITPSITPTVGSGTCSPATAITAPFIKDGAGTFCWQTSNIPGYVNSWSTTSVVINGTNVSNLYVGSGSLPAKIGGYYYIIYNSAVGWGHFEAK